MNEGVAGEDYDRLSRQGTPPPRIGGHPCCLKKGGEQGWREGGYEGGVRGLAQPRGALSSMVSREDIWVEYYISLVIHGAE